MTNGELDVLKAKLDDLETELKQVESVLTMEMSAPPPPPKHLQVRVVGTYSPQFVWSGFHTFVQLESLLMRYINKQFKDFPMILDFGCGCGRIIRAFRSRLPAQMLHGTDIDPEAIDWLRNNYKGMAQFEVNPHMPPMAYTDNAFDLIYSISIFTHLPEDMQFAWLSELQRIAKPGAYLVLTTHGEKHFRNLLGDEHVKITESGFFYRESGSALTEGLPTFYQTSYHAASYIRKEWQSYFDVVAIVPEGLDSWQDVIVLQKRLRQRIERARYEAPGNG
jgi:ubiquinone/menaquinone biosynthesis C-methylase UbiE